MVDAHRVVAIPADESNEPGERVVGERREWT
jgi:hypothetical protein